MKKSIKIIGISSLIIAFWMIILGGCFSNMIVFWIGFFIIIAEAVGVFLWSVNKLNWKCNQCGTVFSISWQQNLTGINGGSVKELYCPHCQKKTWCKPVEK